MFSSPHCSHLSPLKPCQLLIKPFPTSLLQDSNTDISLIPHNLAVVPHRRIPLVEICHADLVLIQHALAGQAVDKVERLTALSHVILDGARCLDSIPRVHGRGTVPDDGHTGIGVRPETDTVAAHRGVPLGELGHGDAVGLRDGVAVFVLLDRVEGIAVVYDLTLKWGGCGDAVAGLGSCRLTKWWLAWW